MRRVTDHFGSTRGATYKHPPIQLNQLRKHMLVCDLAQAKVLLQRIGHFEACCGLGSFEGQPTNTPPSSSVSSANTCLFLDPAQAKVLLQTKGHFKEHYGLLREHSRGAPRILSHPHAGQSSRPSRFQLLRTDVSNQPPSTHLRPAKQ